MTNMASSWRLEIKEYLSSELTSGIEMLSSNEGKRLVARRARVQDIS